MKKSNNVTEDAEEDVSIMIYFTLAFHTWVTYTESSVTLYFI